MEPEVVRRNSNSQRTLSEKFDMYAYYLANNAEQIVSEYLDREVKVDPRPARGASMSFPKPDGGTRYVARTREDANAMRRRWMDEASTTDFYREVQPVFERLRTTITPRVLEFGYEPQLVEALVAVEVADRSWHTTLKTIEDDWGMPEHYAWKEAASTLESCARLAELVNHLKEDGPPGSDRPDT
ncbi:hypothetical protein [Actinomadura nitritigenes]|uniref:hypothetical protein n=1 Tax=Actinomadura nitritigenes TaxID=134602 RepID=UPI003D8F4543